MLAKPYRIDLLDVWSKSGAIKEWKTLVASEPFAWFQSPEWVLPWWSGNHKHKEPFVIGVFADTQLIAIAPWFVSDGIIRCMGDPLNDLNYLPIQPGYDDSQVLRSILRGIKPILPHGANKLVLDCWPKHIHWDSFEYCRLEEESTTISPVLHLSEARGTYFEQLSTQRRHRLAQCIRRFERNMPGAELELPTDPLRIRELALEMLRLREQSLTPRGLELDCEPLSRATFFQGLLSDLIRNDRTTPNIVIAALKVGSEVLAGGLYFSWNRSILKYMQGWNMKYRTLSLGTVLDVFTIDHFARNGLHSVEFGRGDERYKSWLGAEPGMLFNYVVHLQGPLG